MQETGNKITEEEYNGEIAKIRAMVEAKNVTWDVVDVDTQTALAGCAEGILETIDWTKLGLDRAKFIGGDLQDCAVPTIVYSTVIAYDTTKLQSRPDHDRRSLRSARSSPASGRCRRIPSSISNGH